MMPDFIGWIPGIRGCQKSGALSDRHKTPFSAAGTPGYNLGMANIRSMDKSGIFRWATLFTGRIALGLAFSVVLSMVCLAVAWGLYIFSGSSTRMTWLVMLMAGASIGAGLGAYLPWVKLDRHHWPSIAAAIALAMAGGLAGALGGYEYGVNRELECCAEPRTGPFTFAALGAAVAANIAMYLVEAGGIAFRRFRSGKGRSAAP